MNKLNAKKMFFEKPKNILFAIGSMLAITAIVAGSIITIQAARDAQGKYIKECDCDFASTNPSLPNKSASTNNQVKKIAFYDDLYERPLSGQAMIFASLSDVPANITSTATFIKNQIDTHKAYGVKLILILEPGVLSFDRIAAGDFNSSFDSLHLQLKNLGVSDDDMGLVVPFPEFNLPSAPNPDSPWNNPNWDETNFGLMFNNYSQSLTKYFPTAKITVLPNAKSFNQVADGGAGRYRSFLGMFSKIDKKYVYSVGVQGFPWYYRGGPDKEENPSNFLQTALLKEAADYLKVNNVWFNTGSVKAIIKNTGSGPYQYDVPVADRAALLTNSAIVQTELAKQGYQTMVNIFIENKITTEKTNFGFDTSNDDREMFVKYICDLEKARIKISLSV